MFKPDSKSLELKQADSLPSFAQEETLRLADVPFEVGVVLPTDGNGSGKSTVLKTLQKNF